MPLFIKLQTSSRWIDRHATALGKNLLQSEVFAFLAQVTVLLSSIVRLMSRDRSRSLLTIVSAWTGAGTTGLVRGSVDAGWVGIAYGLGRIAPVWRTPLLLGWVATVIQGLWQRREPGPTLENGVLALMGAMGAVAIVEAVAPCWKSSPVSASEMIVVVNTDSGSTKAARRAVRALKREPTRILSIYWVPGSELATTLTDAARSLPPGGRLVVAGGDGTIGKAACLSAMESFELGILPTGTGNDVARSVGIPLYPEEAAALAARGAARPIDLVETILGMFAHAAGMGMTARFAFLTRDIKGWRRPLVYPLRAWQAWRTRTPLAVEVFVDGVPVVFPSPPVELAVVNAPRVGGRIGITIPGSRADDGVVDLIGVYRGAARQIIRGIIHYARSGIDPYPTHAVVRTGHSVEIRSAKPFAVSLDGEPVGVTDCLQASAHHQACYIVVPDR